MQRIELGTFQIEVEIKDGQPVNGTPRMEFLQNNLRESLPLVPDGRYQWRLTMALNNALRPDKTIQEYVDAGTIACPTVGCTAERAVGKDARVASCTDCKDARYWNLMVTAH